MKEDLSTRKQSAKITSNPSFVKLAMKNMVKKSNQSIYHFLLTTIGFGIFILVIAVLGRPSIPNP